VTASGSVWPTITGRPLQTCVLSTLPCVSNPVARLFQRGFDSTAGQRRGPPFIINRASGSVESWRLPQWVPGQSPSRRCILNAFLCILSLSIISDGEFYCATFPGYPSNPPWLWAWFVFCNFYRVSLLLLTYLFTCLFSDDSLWWPWYHALTTIDWLTCYLSASSFSPSAMLLDQAL